MVTGLPRYTEQCGTIKQKLECETYFTISTLLGEMIESVHMEHRGTKWTFTHINEEEEKYRKYSIVN